jgi:UDP-2,3-diacylglucosamine pyrophosphatase LpxH
MIESPLLLIFSDVHLGNYTSLTVPFKEFLNEILINSYWKNLRYIIILGDFFDLLFETPLMIKEKYGEILDLLEEIHIKKGVDFFFILGNHEIPVTRNPLNGAYFDEFSSNKQKFIKLLEDNHFQLSFLKEDRIFQFALLKSEGPNAILEFYDSLHMELKKQITIGQLNLKDDFQGLIIHGYQFDGPEIRYIVSVFWKMLLDSTNQDYKDLADYLWNRVIKEGKKLSSVSYETVKREIDNLNHTLFNTMKLSMKIIEKFEIKRLTKKYYSKKIKEFLEDDDYDLYNINHVIYGHSHEKQDEVKRINDKPVRILNSGAWQHVINPSFIVISEKGKIELKEYK